MKSITKYNKSILFCNEIDKALDNETLDIDKIEIIILIHKYCDEIIERFDYDFEKIYNNITKLDTTIADGEVYKIYESGIFDQYEKGYLFLTDGSCILKHLHTFEKEYYRVLYGDKNSIDKCCCNMNSKHEVNNITSDTIIRTYKYVPESIRK